MGAVQLKLVVFLPERKLGAGHLGTGIGRYGHGCWDFKGCDRLRHLCLRFCSMQMNIDVEGVIFIPVLTLVLAAICYGYARAIRRGQPLTGVQKRMIVYACVFCFGMGYAMVFKNQLKAALRWEDAWV